YAIGWTTLLDVLEDGREFRARVFGGAMAVMAGQELTGRTSAAMQDPELRQAIVTNLRWVVTNRRPLRIYREQTTAQRRYRYETVILPLSSDGRQVDQLLMAATPPLSEAV
uniref:PAS domain-containing protein n=1 Tax=Ferrovibrio sp. TaxID=1917215 RepID=UPI0026080887